MACGLLRVRDRMSGCSPHVSLQQGRISHFDAAPKRQAMTAIHSAIFAVCLLLPVAAGAEDAPRLPAVGDVIYKGVVGKALDAVPMDPEQRVVLQRTNAVVSNTLTGRSLSVWAGLTNPVLLIGGLVWGLLSAYNIKADGPKPKPDTTIVEPVARVEIAQEFETGDPGLETETMQLQAARF